MNISAVGLIILMNIKPTIEFPDFEKLDLRVGKVMAASEPEWSNKLIKMRVDFGSEIGERTILAGLRKFVDFADLVGNKYVFIVNLAARKLGEDVSQGQGMMLVASDGATHCPLNVAAGASIR